MDLDEEAHPLSAVPETADSRNPAGAAAGRRGIFRRDQENRIVTGKAQRLTVATIFSIDGDVGSWTSTVRCADADAGDFKCANGFVFRGRSRLRYFHPLPLLNAHWMAPMINPEGASQID